MTISHINPATLHRNPVFSQGTLAEVGAEASNVVKLTIYFDRDTTLDEIFPASAEVWGMNPTAVTVLQVHALGRAGAHVGIEAIAVV